MSARKQEMEKIKAAYKAGSKYHPETPTLLMPSGEARTRAKGPTRSGLPSIGQQQTLETRTGRSRSPTKKIQKPLLPTQSQIHDENADPNTTAATEDEDNENARMKRAVTRMRRALESLEANMGWTTNSFQMDIDNQE